MPQHMKNRQTQQQKTAQRVWQQLQQQKKRNRQRGQQMRHLQAHQAHQQQLVQKCLVLLQECLQRPLQPQPQPPCAAQARAQVQHPRLQRALHLLPPCLFVGVAGAGLAAGVAELADHQEGAGAGGANKARWQTSLLRMRSWQACSLLPCKAAAAAPPCSQHCTTKASVDWSPHQGGCMGRRPYMQPVLRALARVWQGRQQLQVQGSALLLGRHGTCRTSRRC